MKLKTFDMSGRLLEELEVADLEAARAAVLEDDMCVAFSLFNSEGLLVNEGCYNYDSETETGGWVDWPSCPKCKAMMVNGNCVDCVEA